MTAAEVLTSLVDAGVVVWAEGDRLRFSAPTGALTVELRAHAARLRPSLIALVRSGVVLPADLEAWSESVAHEREERAGILEFDAGMTRPAAEREAERLVRGAFTRAAIQKLLPRRT